LAKPIFGENCEKMLALSVASVVAAPPGMASLGS
jgi:hypothetical protein